MIGIWAGFVYSIAPSSIWNNMQRSRAYINPESLRLFWRITSLHELNTKFTFSVSVAHVTWKYTLRSGFWLAAFRNRFRMYLIPSSSSPNPPEKSLNASIDLIST